MQLDINMYCNIPVQEIGIYQRYNLHQRRQIFYAQLLATMLQLAPEIRLQMSFAFRKVEGRCFQLKVQRHIIVHTFL